MDNIKGTETGTETGEDTINRTGMGTGTNSANKWKCSQHVLIIINY